LARDGENPEGFEEFVTHVGDKPANVDAATRGAFNDLYQLCGRSQRPAALHARDPSTILTRSISIPKVLNLDRD
jgi:hypothetical protein